MSRYREWDLSCKVYVGNLGNSASKHEIESAFSKYGPLRNVWVARNPPGFAFVEFEDPRDAEDAVRGLDGTRCCGTRVRVEMSSGRSRRGGGGRRPGPRYSRNVWVARNPPGFAFVEFEDPRDAEDAVRGLDGTRCCGTRVRVEMSSGRSRRGGGGRRPGPRYSR
ncbi:RNA-binding protein 1 [Eufriesea mexicana]|uniref:RNA-binding protein 1 n=1 Tax=Eufriesea mexicana TaxID=516756 RepID=A0A310ST41_9HYME|nr:RNA-binding protein 1 [Eufriesea mexicana]